MSISTLATQIRPKSRFKSRRGLGFDWRIACSVAQALATTDIEYHFPFGWGELWPVMPRSQPKAPRGPSSLLPRPNRAHSPALALLAARAPGCSGAPEHHGC